MRRWNGDGGPRIRGDAFVRFVVIWNESAHGQLIAPVVSLVFVTFLASRLFSLGVGDAYVEGWPLVLLCLYVLAVAAPFFRRRASFAVVATESAVLFASGMFGWEAVFFVPFALALYAAIARGSVRWAAASGCIAACAWIALMLIRHTATIPFLGFWSMAVVVAALASRLMWSRIEGQRLLESERHARKLAEGRNRIAGELHDSVGHDLTAIIALAEGLSESNDDEIRQITSLIGDLARSGLTDTRNAVQAITAGDGFCETSLCKERLHDLDELKPCLESARATGIAAMFTTTGKHLHDSRQDDLAFRIAREAMTNAMRHGAGITRISVAIDFDEKGDCTVTVRDDGVSYEAQPHVGFGLSRLKSEVEAAGGVLRAGPAGERGWELTAVIPLAADEEGRDENDD